MKKKVAWLVNLATICLCVCAIVIGVYAVKTATLNVGGTVGFTANNCNVKITSTVKCAENTTDSTAEWKALTSRFIELGAKENSGTANNNQVTKSSEGSLDIGTMNFNDLSDKGNIVEVTFLVENKSAFDILLTIAESGMPTLTNGSADMSDVAVEFKNGTTALNSSSEITIAKSDSVTLTVTLTVANILNVDETTLKEAKLNMGLKFEKYVALDAYLAINWQRLICTDDYGNSNGFCTCSNIRSISFVSTLPSDITFDSKVISVGANDTTSDRPTSGKLNEGIEEVYAYGYNNTSLNGYSIYFLSKGKIYIGDKSYICSAGEFNTTPESGYQFGQMLWLFKIDLGNASFAKCTTTNHMFYACQNLTSVDLSGVNALDITSMEYMFMNCYQLTNVDLTGLNTSKVTNMASMFEECSGLTSLNLTTFDTLKVTNMNRMFYYASNLKTITVGSGWVINSSCSTAGMFSGCGCSAVTKP